MTVQLYNKMLSVEKHGEAFKLASEIKHLVASLKVTL